jgi:DNA uptake protein ComE-like DNA-binding protein
MKSIFDQLNHWQPLAFGLCSAMLLLGGCASSSTPEASSSAPPPTVSSSSSASSSPSAANPASTAGTKIDINSAPISELDKLELPGTKPSLSERIQGGRPYNSPDDLVSKKVISEDEYKLIKGLVTVGKSK